MKSLKPLLVLGAFLGFLSGVLLGLLNHSDWPAILWRASAAALVLGVLLRWWGRCWADCLRVAQQERFAVLMAQRQEQKEKEKEKEKQSKNPRASKP